MAEFFNFIKDILAEKRALLFSFGFAMLTVLSSSDMTLALSVGIMATVSLTAASAVTSVLKRFTGELGSFMIYVSLISFVSALAAVFVSLYFPGIKESFPLISAILPVSGLLFLVYPKNDSVIYSAFRSLTTGVILLISALFVSFFRELFGKGSLFGVKIAEFSIPFLSDISGGFILCGVILAAANAIFRFVLSKKAKKSQKNEINTEADDADS